MLNIIEGPLLTHLIPIRIETARTEVGVSRSHSRDASFDSSQSFIIFPFHILKNGSVTYIYIFLNVHFTPNRRRKSCVWGRDLCEGGIVEFAGLVAAGGQAQTLVSPGLQENPASVGTERRSGHHGKLQSVTIGDELFKSQNALTYKSLSPLFFSSSLMQVALL